MNITDEAGTHGNRAHQPPEENPVVISAYKGEEEIKDIVALVEGELSEPYTIFTYRYFVNDWPDLCLFARVNNQAVGVVVGKQDYHKNGRNRGYIAMLSISPAYRRRGLAQILVEQVLHKMKEQGAEEIVLETEVDNTQALALYEKLGFIREKQLHAFYLNRKSAFRLVLPVAQEAQATMTGESNAEPEILAQVSDMYL